MSNNDHRKTVGEWLSKPYEWRIPVYQRHYAWNPDDGFGPTQLFWEIVEEQACKRLNKKNVDPHYFGAILVENKNNRDEFPNIHMYDVVDGQQRLTTINVAMFAIIGVASQLDYRGKVQGKLAKYIFNGSSPDAREQPKLAPTNFDRTQFSNLLCSAFDQEQLNQDDNERAQQSKIVQACNFFKEQFKEFIETRGNDNELAAIDALIDTIVDGFELVLIPLKKTDEAQKVFESLNNTATPLTTFDLIRNNIFYRADKAETGLDVRLFNSDRWMQFEDPFWEKKHGQRKDGNTHVEAYMARMLMAKRKRFLPLSRNSIFKEYKDFANLEGCKALDVKTEIKTISEYVDTYKYLVGESNRNPLGADFEFGYFLFTWCKSMDFYPTIFSIVTCDVSVEEKQEMLSLLESYVIRRHICGLPSGDYNKQAPRICKELGNKPSCEKLDEFLKESKDATTRTFPGKKEISTGCLNNNFYKKDRNLKIYIFNKIARHTTTTRNEQRDTSGLTIDHIMPQTWTEKNGWKQASNQFKDEDIDRKIHTIGNLTPMSKGLNSQKSNHDWNGEKGARSWLRKCDLTMTRDLSDKDKWDIDDIDKRSEELATTICKIWLEDIEHG